MASRRKQSRKKGRARPPTPVACGADGKVYPCKVCSKPFPSLSKLTRHEIVHTGEKPFRCPLCRALFTQNSSLKTHAKLRHAEPDRARYIASVRKQEGPAAVELWSDLDPFWTIPKRFLRTQPGTGCDGDDAPQSRGLGAALVAASAPRRHSSRRKKRRLNYAADATAELDLDDPLSDHEPSVGFASRPSPDHESGVGFASRPSPPPGAVVFPLPQPPAPAMADLPPRNGFNNADEFGYPDLAAPSSSAMDGVDGLVKHEPALSRAAVLGGVGPDTIGSSSSPLAPLDAQAASGLNMLLPGLPAMPLPSSDWAALLGQTMLPDALQQRDLTASMMPMLMPPPLPWRVPGFDPSMGFDDLPFLSECG